MARKLRIEFAGARYHVINRGNYRSWIFKTSGARASFLDYLAPHRWIAARLNMGGAGSVQTLVSRHRRESGQQSATWKVLNNYEILD